MRALFPSRSVKLRVSPKPSTPFNINRWVLLSIYFTVCCVGGNVISAAEPLKDLMRTRGIFSARADPEKYLTEATNLGASVSIYVALFGGLLNDFGGPRVAAFIGQASSAVGFFLVFASPRDSFFLVSLGCCILGAAYACVSISHTSIAALFPRKATWAIAVLCVGNDISLAVPTVLKKLGVTFARGRVEPAVYCYCILCLAIGCAECMLVPSGPFRPPIDPYQNEQSTRLKSGGPSYQAATSDISATSKDMTSWSLREQIKHRVYWVITIFVCFSFFRKQYYAQLVRQINLTIAELSGKSANDAFTVTSAFRVLLPSVSIGSLVTGAMVTQRGPLFGILLLNTYAVGLFVVTSIPVLRLQWLAIIFYNLFSGFIFGLMYAYLGTFYGFDNIGTLQGALKVLCGTAGLLFNPWSDYVNPRLPNVLWGNRIILIASICCYTVPLYLIYYPPSSYKIHKGASRIVSSEKVIPIPDNNNFWGKTSATFTLEAPLDRVSLALMCKESISGCSRTRPKLDVRYYADPVP